MNTNEESRAVSPVVGVILVVAITVALSGVIGVFVSDLGQKTSDGTTQESLGVKTTTDGSNISVLVVTGGADTLHILLDGTKDSTLISPQPGEALTTLNATKYTEVTVVSETEGTTSVHSTANPLTREPVPEDYLVAHYPFDDSSTPSTLMDAAYSNDGTINAATYKPGWTNTALYFDGTTDASVSQTDWLNITQQVTVSVWSELPRPTQQRFALLP